jgi:hypothetical protein
MNDLPQIIERLLLARLQVKEISRSPIPDP